MIMGANMGTTVMSTLAALGNLREVKVFNRSFAAATVRDFLNLLTILILLPLAMMFHPLERLAGYLAGFFQGAGDASIAQFDFIGTITRPAINEIRDLIRLPSMDSPWYPRRPSDALVAACCPRRYRAIASEALAAASGQSK